MWRFQFQLSSKLNSLPLHQGIFKIVQAFKRTKTIKTLLNLMMNVTAFGLCLLCARWVLMFQNWSSPFLMESLSLYLSWYLFLSFMFENWPSPFLRESLFLKWFSRWWAPTPVCVWIFTWNGKVNVRGRLDGWGPSFLWKNLGKRRRIRRDSWDDQISYS